MWVPSQPPPPLLPRWEPHPQRGGGGGLAALHRARGLLTKGSHRSVKSFCTSLRWEILSSCPGQPEPQSRGSLLNTVNFHLGHCSPMQGRPGAC